MSCRVHADAIVDLARGAVIHADTDAAARAHLAECRRCALRLARQRELTADLRRLAAASAGASPSSRVKDRVLAAFAADRAPVAVGARPLAGGPPVAPEQRDLRRLPVLWTAAAATVVLAAAGLAVWSGAFGPTRRVASAPVAARLRPAPTPPPAGADTVLSRPVAAAPTHRARKPPARPAPPVEAFLPVPGSAVLPDLESGRIVRVELPVAALPAYGVAIAPDAARLEVAADLLIGQDGHTRAIRLVQRRRPK